MSTATDSTLGRLINSLAHLLEESGPGLAAELRRLNPGAADRWRSPGFYRLYTNIITADHGWDDDHQRRWAMVVSGLALLPHRQGLKPGVLLAQAHFAERRFARLLSADENHLGDELRAAVTFLKARDGRGVDWLALATLVLTDPGSEPGDRCRRAFADDFFRNLP